MIIDLKRFISTRRSEWDECERTLDRMEDEPRLRLSIEEAQRFHYLLERVAADLNQINTAAADPAIRAYLESLLSRGYSEVQETQRLPVFRVMAYWLAFTFPQTVRRHFGALKLVLFAFFAGVFFGGFALMLDPEAKPVIIGFDHLMGSPSERVAEEEANRGSNLEDGKSTFSAFLMTHNIKVSIFTLALGMTFGIGTIINLFYNGVILGAVGFDYVLAGETKFLCGWLLPHGSIEIPAILLAGQAGLVLGQALLFRDGDKGLVSRMRAIRKDLLTLIGGVAVMLVWAGIVEAFFSQYHEPVLPYSVKIGFGMVQLIGLIAFLMFAGRKHTLSLNEEEPK
ncbi:stage II sporulation protein M [Cerasicoccus fimbriatus]|uniref:stage II sporulation protein M n=1 Tax=Cerasicoccus fimbriatus TaxID=3014554 RepID=UPI0022B48746|nr:stage II sporulation protein M [Cerasicoccus sp. TK19100]